MHQLWQGEAAFVFCKKARSRIKALRWDKHGGWWCLRCLHQGEFIWPRQGDVAWMLSTEQAYGLMKGIDGQRVDGLDLTNYK
ncbi:IS66 family insertion sequence element accessory protein TnpB [Serratia symbiotica]|uniref:IS66 family insertion sequence element accessory protein TnpB n=1 Tax=Serratia symbiotica TaxID=138074 RepID=UPI0030D29022